MFLVSKSNFNSLTVKGKKEFLNASVLHCRTGMQPGLGYDPCRAHYRIYGHDNDF